MAEVIVAGHICLDIIPEMFAAGDNISQILAPGKLVNVGASAMATGGAVANTGIALHRLGFDVSLLGKIGDDLFGDGIRGVLQSEGESLDSGMIVCEGENSSYSVVISPPGIDRIFMHCPGANDTFEASDIDAEKVRGVRLFHFGYPPLMRKMFLNDGAELKKMMAAVKATGACTSLDMTRPDPASESGKLDWLKLLKNALPEVDVFMPSVEELFFMLEREAYDKVEAEVGPDGVLDKVDGELLSRLSGKILEMGPKVAVIKVGYYGLYIRTASDAGSLKLFENLSDEEKAAWNDRELYTPCYNATVVGTTGSGDCTIAGVLAGMLKGLSPEGVVNSGVAVGSFSVEAAAATAGIQPWEKVTARQDAGWTKMDKLVPLSGWTIDEETAVWKR